MQAIHSLASSLHDSTLLAPGPWHWLFLLPGMLSPQIICMALSPRRVFAQLDLVFCTSLDQPV